MPRRVLVTGAGGPAGINFARSLRLAPEPFYLIGTDANPYNLLRAETDARHLVPSAGVADYIADMKAIVADSGVEVIYAGSDAEVNVISRERAHLTSQGVRVFFPRHATVETCQNKYQSYLRWKATGLKVPETIFLNGPADLVQAFARLGSRVWLRNMTGGAGRGALPVSGPDEARVWIDFHQGWGTFIASERLEATSVTWQSIWRDGALMVAQGRQRLYWEFSDRAPSGVTGQTGAAMTVSDPTVDRIAQEAIRAIDERPHGIFSVDMTYDRDGVPNPTEINIARFFTTHLFFARAGLNMPYLFVRLALGDPVDFTPPLLNPLRPGLVWIRGIDVEPILTDTAALSAITQAQPSRRETARETT